MKAAGRLAGAVVAAALAACAGPTAAAAQSPGESTRETICRLIEEAARTHTLPVRFFSRLIWRESSFRPGVTSPAGAQGIAQFMPGTAAARGLADPFDPETAIPASAGYLAALRKQFGNLGLAAAAYNAGPTRLSRWQASGGFLPAETQGYVAFITGRSVEDWAQPGVKDEAAEDSPCLTVVAAIAIERPRLLEGVYAPFGVQLSGNVSKARALASYQRVVTRFPSLLADRPTLILGSRIAGRGRHPFYRVRLPAQSLREAAAFCNQLRRAGGSCAVLRN